MTVNDFQKAIVDWYGRNGRDFPWRRTRDPYRVLIAEVMLQRTGAQQVVPVYEKFINNFPDIKSTEKIRRKDVEDYFSRLGLLWRSKTFFSLLESIKNGIPGTKEELMKLPSVGDYISDAVLCFTRGKKTAIIDSNIVRIFMRVHGLKLRGEVRRNRNFRRTVERYVPNRNIREYNWGLIDMGTLLCRPVNPLCGDCPVKDLCKYGENK